MRRGGAVMLALILVGLVFAGRTDTVLSLPVVRVNGRCTGWVVSPGVVATASHCVGMEGDEARVEFTAGYFVSAKIVRDVRAHDYSLDLAFLQLPYRTPARWPLAGPECLPSVGEQVEVTHASIALWPPLVTKAESLGVRHQPRLGWVVVLRGFVYPGASGSPVRKECGVVGMITHGIVGSPSIVFGPISGRIRNAFKEIGEVRDDEMGRR